MIDGAIAGESRQRSTGGGSNGCRGKFIHPASQNWEGGGIGGSGEYVRLGPDLIMWRACFLDRAASSDRGQGSAQVSKRASDLSPANDHGESPKAIVGRAEPRGAKTGRRSLAERADSCVTRPRTLSLICRRGRGRGRRRRYRPGTNLIALGRGALASSPRYRRYSCAPH